MYNIAVYYCDIQPRKVMVWCEPVVLAGWKSKRAENQKRGSIVAAAEFLNLLPHLYKAAAAEI